MQRCLQLATLGAGHVAPNPMVGAVLVHNDTIIGEGFHQLYGHAHAEVNCINSVSAVNQNLIAKSTLYVSLEPCAHHGKTPPCADLIIQHKIPLVVIACRDSYKEVDGKGIQKLLEAGIQVIAGVLEAGALQLNRRFFTFHTKQRPYVILKWAQSGDLKIGREDLSAIRISHALSNRLVHRWRSEEAAIMVGFNTALHDDPLLTTRLWPGKNPVRIVADRHLKLPGTLHIFDRTVKTIIFNEVLHEEQQGLLWYKLDSAKNLLPAILNALHQLGIQSIFVEGGAALLQSFIDQNYWDEARVITNEALIVGNGIDAPHLTNHSWISTQQISTDKITIFKNTAPK